MPPVVSCAKPCAHKSSIGISRPKQICLLRDIASLLRRSDTVWNEFSLKLDLCGFCNEVRSPRINARVHVFRNLRVSIGHTHKPEIARGVRRPGVETTLERRLMSSRLVAAPGKYDRVDSPP